MQLQIEPIAAAILAGGKSSRMGQSKALLPYEGRRLVDHMVQVAAKTGCAPIVISGHVHGYRCVDDIIPESGPVGGIHAVMRTAIKENLPRAWLFIPVDMPLVTPEILTRLTHCACTYDHDGACFENRPLPLLLRLHEHVNSAIEEAALTFSSPQKASVKKLISHLDICRHTVSEQDMLQLANTNTPQEWENIRRESTHQ